jgi:hypothetical protein
MSIPSIVPMPLAGDRGIGTLGLDASLEVVDPSTPDSDAIAAEK